MGGPVKAGPAQTPQFRIAGWHQACRFATCLNRAGYRFTDTPCTNLQPGQYTGRPLLAAPEVRPRPWLVAWRPRPAPAQGTKAQAPEASPRFLEAVDAACEVTAGCGLLIAGVFLAAMALRLGWTLSETGAASDGLDTFLILGGLAVANALLFAAAGRIVPVLGQAWRACQRRVGLWLLPRSYRFARD